MGNHCLGDMGFPVGEMKMCWNELVVNIVQYCECTVIHGKFYIKFYHTKNHLINYFLKDC